MSRCLTMVLVCISLMICDVGQLFLYVLAVWIFYSKKYLFRSFAHFKIGLFGGFAIELHDILDSDLLFWIVTSYQICSSRMFSPIHKRPCHFAVHFFFCPEAFLSDVHIVLCVHSHSVMSYTLRPIDCDPLVSSVHGVFQARLLEWIAFSYSRGSSKQRSNLGLSHLLHLHWQAGSLSPMPPGKHKLYY